METDLMHYRRWLFEDFKARTALLVPPLLQANPKMGAFDLMAAVGVMEAPIPLGPERQAYLLDLYLINRWAGEAPPAPALRPTRRRPKNPTTTQRRRLAVAG